MIRSPKKIYIFYLKENIKKESTFTTVNRLSSLTYVYIHKYAANLIKINAREINGKNFKQIHSRTTRINLYISLKT